MKIPNLLPLAIVASACLPLEAEQVGPWNLAALKDNVPAMNWIDRDQPVHSLTYAGEKYLGKETEVFAFYASPSTLGLAKPGTVSCASLSGLVPAARSARSNHGGHEGPR